jgi:general secretion pathway protein E
MREYVLQEKLNNTADDISSKKLSFSFAKKYGAILIDNNKDSIIYFHSFPGLGVIAEIERFAGKSLTLKKLPQQELKIKLEDFYQNNSSDALIHAAGMSDEFSASTLADAVPATEDLLEKNDDAPVIKLINALLTEAIKQSASDIHIESYEASLVVRIRVDGVLKEILTLQRSIASLLVSRIKVMAKLDIAEKRIPQDGRISIKVAGREVDVRVSTLPSSNGERVVLRLLDKTAGKLDLNHLGMTKPIKQKIEDLLTKSYGIILVTGPTGSGKTTTLYASLEQLNSESRNILTIEDPIEYNLEGIGQTQVNSKVDMTFARGLRAILRQDPDVVMVGEIRDSETAEIAVQASLTGHLVLSTLHTNTAIGAITRLRDMGIETFLLASSLLGVVSQRLIRLLCPLCKKAYTPDQIEKNQLGIPLDDNSTKLYHAVGCQECNFSGYRNRTGIYEVLKIDDKIRRMIHEDASEQKIADYAHASDDIQSDGYQKVLNGDTTLEEVLRVTHKE